MNNNLILDFINGPLKNYLSGKLDFETFVESTNLICDCTFTEKDLSESFLTEYHANQLEPTAVVQIPKVYELNEFDKRMRICHQYGLCIQKDIELFMCGTCDVCPRDKSESKAFKKVETDET